MNGQKAFLKSKKSAKDKPISISKRSYKWIKGITFVALAVLITMFLNAGNWLTVNQKPVKADIIIVLSGADGRSEAGLQLIDEGYSDILVLSNAYGFSEQEYNLIDDSLPSDSVWKDYDSFSTLDSAYYSRKLMDEQQLQSAIIVSSDYHLRRAKLNYGRAFKDSEIDLTFVASKSKYQSSFWWTDKHSIGVTGSEYIKLVGNLVGIHGSFAKKKLYDFDNYFFS
ncbi:YdcF family protein [Anaerobacillus sp. 1_MG-2023]|uniref:YdcF family protein n=1 Tax=Bacillales TaxID=1385 RepID=UPI0026E44CEE|nr:YdcF family protein [Anaerobacillus sp. 1_MG-2023]MDO6657807.1 YdcF family protein [Anaerobacillus sp. 1_MG-2023]